MATLIKGKSLAAIVADPLRAQCWTILAERTASPSEIRKELGVSIEGVAYHVRVLKDLGIIELVDERQVRGAVKHFYRAVERINLDGDGTAELSPEECIENGRQCLQLAFADATLSLESGALCNRRDHHTARLPMHVDEQGWGEANEIMAEALEKLFDVQVASAERLQDGRELIPISTFLMCLELPARAAKAAP